MPLKVNVETNLSVAITGTRRGVDDDLANKCIEIGRILAKCNVFMINGGSYGVDKYCLQGFKEISDRYLIFWPTEAKRTPKGDYRLVNGGFLDRNKKMVEKCDVLIVVASKNERSGTGNTYRNAVKLGKKIITIIGNHTSPYYEEHADYLIDDILDLHRILVNLKLSKAKFLY